MTILSQRHNQLQKALSTSANMFMTQVSRYPLQISQIMTGNCVCDGGGVSHGHVLWGVGVSITPGGKQVSLHMVCSAM